MPVYERSSLAFLEMAEQPCPDLMEVTLFVPQGENITDFLVGAETRFGTMSIYLDDYEQYVEFGLSKATLRLSLAGCTIIPGTRFGDPDHQPITTSIKRSNVRGRRNENKGALGFAGQLALSQNPSVAGKAETDLKHSRENVVEEREIVEENFALTSGPVVALSGNRWEFSALDRKILKAKYSGDETLCKIRITGRKVAVTGDFYFYAKDIVIFDGEKSGRKLSRVCTQVID